MTHALYRDHPIRAQLAQLLDMQGRDEFTDPAVAENEPVAFARDKVFGLTRLIASLLDAVPATLASTVAVSNMHAQLQQPISELVNFLSNRNSGHIVNAAAQFDQNVMPLLWGLPQPIGPLGTEPLSAIVAKQAQASSEAVRQLNEQRSELEHRFAVVRAQADSLTSQLQSQTEAVARERAEAVATVANLQKEFADREIERGKSFEASAERQRHESRAEIEKLSNQVKELSEGHKGTFDSLVADLGRRTTELVEQIDIKREEAARIVQVVGNIGVTGNYQQIANVEAKEADFWRWATVIFFGAGISLAGMTFYKFWHEPLSTESLLSVAIRLLYAIAITAPALYTARESARHRSNSDRARQTELELASIGPFIELMPDEKKVEIREALTRSYFGRQIEPHEVSSPLDVGGIKDLVIETIKAVRK